jgi:threonine synthase
LGGPPGSVIAPVGHGSLMLGMGRGFTALRNANIIADVPVLIGVQARVCAPLWALSSYGPSGLGWVSEGKTIAEGIRIQFPIRGDAILQCVEKSNGRFVVVDEDEILSGMKQLTRCGFFVEPTSATVWAALRHVVGDVPEPIVVILTGSGYKSGVELFSESTL